MGVYDQAARWAANTDAGPVVYRLQRQQGTRLRLVPASEQSDLRTVVLHFATLAGCLAVWDDEMENWNMIESRLLKREIESGQLKQGREWLIDFLQARFPNEVTPEVIATINQQPSLSLLHTWFKDAVKAGSYNDFLSVLRR
jgi:hypothetical protein